MGCFPSSEPPPPPPKTGGYKPPPPPSAEELERERREKEEEEKWKNIAKSQLPEPFPKPQFKPGGNEEEYKEFMRKRLEYETWENQVILLGRKLRQQQQT